MRWIFEYSAFCLLLLLALIHLSAGAQSKSEVLEKSQDRPVVKTEDLLRLSNPDLAKGSEALRFQKTTLSLGRITSDTASANGSFSFLYSGREKISITKVTSSCACLKAAVDPKILTTGTKGTVSVSYFPKGHFGSVSQRLFLYTTLSATSPTAVLTVSAEVSSDESDDFPFSLGELKVRRKEISFKISESKAVERIVCFNSSDKPLTIKALKEFTPSGLSFRTDPQVIPPRSEGDLVVSWNKDDASGTTLSKGELSLILEGIGVPPSKRTIKIRLIK